MVAAQGDARVRLCPTLERMLSHQAAAARDQLAAALVACQVSVREWAEHTLVGFCQANVLTTLGLPFRYRASIFNGSQSPLHEELMLRASSVTTRTMSGRSSEK